MDDNVKKTRKKPGVKPEPEQPEQVTTLEHNNHRITIEPPNAVNKLHRIIVSTLHGTHVAEWIEGKSGIAKAKEFIDNAER